MLDIKYLRQNIELVHRKMDERGQKIDFDRFLSLDAKRRDILQAVETLRNERNSVSKQVGELKKKKEDASELIAKMGDVSAKIKEYDESLRVTEEELNAFVMIVPNIQHESVPQGGGSDDNAVVRTWGEKPVFCFEPKQHFDLGENLNILDFARGAKITGARFTLYRGAGAQLERAITNFMLDLHTGNHGYTEVFTPFMVNAESMTGTGQLPKFKEDLFKIEGMEYYLIPTAEVPVTNIYRDEILEEDKLPVYLVAYSACFRAAAGCYGKDTSWIL
jgi:seryl-tRNA synthetase